jgi:hypothetical protein
VQTEHVTPDSREAITSQSLITALWSDSKSSGGLASSVGSMFDFSVSVVCDPGAVFSKIMPLDIRGR